MNSGHAGDTVGACEISGQPALVADRSPQQRVIAIRWHAGHLSNRFGEGRWAAGVLEAPTVDAYAGGQAPQIEGVLLSGLLEERQAQREKRERDGMALIGGHMLKLTTTMRLPLFAPFHRRG